MNYWIARGGQQHGPYPLAEVRRMIAEGRVAPTDLAWGEGMPSWQPVSQVFPAAPPPQQAPPGPAQYGPPVQQPNYGQPPYGQPAYGMAALAPSPGGGPIPPALHWGLVFLFGMLTMGIFTLVWIFIEANFVKRIDPRNNSRMLFILVFVLEFVYFGLAVLVATSGGGRDAQALGLIALVLGLTMAVCSITAIFKMRSSLINYYNTVEPINLRLSGVMTFFFNIYYFQHHFTRIAEWKRTGQLTPQ